MGQALYRKYRPRKFSQAVGQEPIAKTLSEAIKTGRVSHAYLFTGPRGVGKTSFARVLAHEINGLAYTEDVMHLDIIEIDAASNRRIDEIRDLRDKVHISPTSAKYKVYIIDEVHMLTKEAFNALLKTLEEPPEHCIFILATTEAHKLPETIISRTQRFNFKPIGPADTKKQLQTIIKGEKIDIDAQALQLLAEFSDGSLRDIIGMLDQLSSSGKRINEADVRDLLGMPPKDIIAKLVEAVASAQPAAAMELLDSLKNQGLEPTLVAKSLGQELRGAFLADKLSGDWLSGLLRGLVSVPSSPQPQEMLEIVILEASSRTDDSLEQEKPPIDTPMSTTPRPPKKVVKSKPAIDQTSQQSTKGNWDDVLAIVRDKAPALSDLLRQAKPEFSDGKLEIVFSFSLHRKKASEAQNMRIISTAVEQVYGTGIRVTYTFDKEAVSTGPVSPSIMPKESTQLESISNIFGTAEVLES